MIYNFKNSRIEDKIYISYVNIKDLTLNLYRFIILIIL